MTMELIALALGFSLGANLVLGLRLWSLKKARLALAEAHAKELEAAKKAPRPTATAEQILADLASGSSVIRVERINPDQLFHWSPRA